MIQAITGYGLVGYVCTIPKVVGLVQALTLLAVVKVLCDDSIGCDIVGDYFATEADTMIDIV